MPPTLKKYFQPYSLLIPTQSSTRSYPDNSDATEKINQRIEKQLAELEHAPRKKVYIWFLSFDLQNF